MEGRKDDSTKVRMDLLPEEALEEVAKVLTFGATKYSPWNWKEGMDWSRLIAAAKRHLSAFIRRQDLDVETGYSHLSHAICCLMFLETYRQLGLGTDDRWKAAPPKERSEDAKQVFVEAIRQEIKSREETIKTNLAAFGRSLLNPLNSAIIPKCQSPKTSLKCQTQSSPDGFVKDEPSGRQPSTRPRNAQPRRPRLARSQRTSASRKARS